MGDLCHSWGKSNDIPGFQPSFGHHGGFTTICCRAAAPHPPCIFICLYKCVSGTGRWGGGSHPSYPPLHVLRILVTLLSSLQRVLPLFSGPACDLDSSCDNSETKVLFATVISLSFLSVLLIYDLLLCVCAEGGVIIHHVPTEDIQKRIKHQDDTDHESSAAKLAKTEKP